MLDACPFFIAPRECCANSGSYTSVTSMMSYRPGSLVCDHLLSPELYPEKKLSLISVSYIFYVGGNLFGTCLAAICFEALQIEKRYVPAISPQSKK